MRKLAYITPVTEITVLQSEGFLSSISYERPSNATDDDPTNDDEITVDNSGGGDDVNPSKVFDMWDFDLW